MIDFSFASLLICLVVTNLLIIFCACILNSNKLLIRIGYSLLGFILLLIVIRLLLPYEFSFTQTFWLPEYVSKLITWLLHPALHIGCISFSLWNIMVGIWIIGSLLCFVYYSYLYCLSVKRIKESISNNDVKQIRKYEYLISEICQKLNKKNTFRIIISDISVPSYFYYRGPCIVLPENIEFSQKDLYFILRHEMNHHFHHDLIIKYMMILLAIVYWWNPFCYLLKKQCNTVLEMRTDNKLTEDNSDLIIDYLNCLINTAKRISAEKQHYTIGIPFCSRNSSQFIQRCSLLMQKNQHKKTYICYIPAIIIPVVLFISSYLYQFNSSYTPAFIENEYIVPDKNNIYAIKKANNTYDIYLFGKYSETVDTLDFYSNSITVYEKGEMK